MHIILIARRSLYLMHKLLSIIWKNQFRDTINHTKGTYRYKLMYSHKASGSQMDLLYESKDNYNLKSLRNSITMRTNPYENYRLSRTATARGIIRFNNLAQTRKRKQQFDPNKFNWIVKYFPGAPDYDKALDEMIQIWKADPDLIGPLGIFDRAEFKTHSKRYDNLRETLMTFKVFGHEKESFKEEEEKALESNAQDDDASHTENDPSNPASNAIDKRIRFNALSATSQILFTNIYSNLIEIERTTDQSRNNDNPLDPNRLNHPNTNALIIEYFNEFQVRSNMIRQISSLPTIPSIIHASQQYKMTKTGHRDIRSFIKPIDHTTILKATRRANKNNNTKQRLEHKTNEANSMDDDDDDLKQ
eukprot:769041_1